MPLTTLVRLRRSVIKREERGVTTSRNSYCVASIVRGPSTLYTRFPRWEQVGSLASYARARVTPFPMLSPWPAFIVQSDTGHGTNATLGGRRV